MDVIGEKQNRGAFCPSCERFIGPVDVCPYCECDSARNPAFRLLGYGSLILAAAGLFFLHLMAAHSVIPIVRISDIGPMMNFGLVRIEGTVEKAAYLGNRRGTVDSVSFPASDGSGRIRVVAYGAVARDLVGKSLVPCQGMTIDVSGSLNYSADGNTKLILRSAGELRVKNESGKRGKGETGKRKKGEEPPIVPIGAD